MGDYYSLSKRASCCNFCFPLPRRFFPLHEVHHRSCLSLQSMSWKSFILSHILRCSATHGIGLLLHLELFRLDEANRKLERKKLQFDNSSLESVEKALVQLNFLTHYRIRNFLRSQISSRLNGPSQIRSSWFPSTHGMFYFREERSR